MSPPDAEPPRPRWDRQLWLAVLVAAAVVVPRTLLVSRAHSEYWDDQYHLSQGLSLVLGTKTGVIRNDPPLGQMVLSVPMLLAGCVPPRPEESPAASPDGPAPLYIAVLYGHRLAPETISMMVAAWKALLFLPLAGLVFHWCRRLYGTAGGWLGLALLLVEPTVAGHIAPAALDLLGVEAIAFACYFAWAAFGRPTAARLVTAGLFTAAAMLTKHTAVILPFVVAAYALAHWLRDRRPPAPAPMPALATAPASAPDATSARARMNQFFAVGVVAVVALWPLTAFDVSRPADHAPLVNAVYTEGFSFKADLVNGALMRRWPAGAYLGSVRGAQSHAEEGHPAYLWGRRRAHGWWYYYPVVALYKVPLGVGLAILAAALSLPWRRPSFDELPLAIAAVAWAVFVMVGGIHIGFRHALPAYVPLLMLCGRAAATGRNANARPVHWLAWAGVAAAGVHTLTWHPDYLSYTNFPRDKPYLAVSDSNVDWGQSLKQVRRWLDARPRDGRPVSIGYFGNEQGRSVRHHLGDRVRELRGSDAAPAEGLLVISPVWVAGAYGHEQYAFLRRRTPDAVIGHSMLVYDLDRDREPDRATPGHAPAPLAE